MDKVGQIETLKRSLIQLESKISEAKTKKDMLKARSQAAKAQEQLQSAQSGALAITVPWQPLSGWKKKFSKLKPVLKLRGNCWSRSRE